MADTKISALTAITGANTATGDLFPVVDVDDTTMAASGTDKKITRAELLAAMAQEGTTFQPLDATLTAFAGISTGANKFPYSTGTDTFSQADIIPGAWTSFTPTLGAGWALGNATYTAVYARIGRMVTFGVSLTIGNSTTIGTGLTVALPVTAASADAVMAGTIIGQLQDVGTAIYIGVPRIANTSSTVVEFACLNASGSYSNAVQVTSTVPFTWATSDRFFLGGTYEAAS